MYYLIKAQQPGVPCSLSEWPAVRPPAGPAWPGRLRYGLHHSTSTVKVTGGSLKRFSIHTSRRLCAERNDFTPSGSAVAYSMKAT